MSTALLIESLSLRRSRIESLPKGLSGAPTDPTALMQTLLTKSCQTHVPGFVSFCLAFQCIVVKWLLRGRACAVLQIVVLMAFIGFYEALSGMHSDLNMVEY